jgi:hypothetical protein
VPSRAPDSFLIVGGAGTDQIQACARDSVLRQGKVPYLSAGVTTNGLEEIPTYFASTMTYKQQSNTIIRMAKEQGFFKAGDTWALVLPQSPNFADARGSMEAALKGAGVKVQYFEAPKAGGDAGPVASRLAAGGFPVVYFLGQPIYFADLVRKAAGPSYQPFWVGPGVSMGVNSIAQLTCGNRLYNGKGFFLSPYPGYDRKSQVAGNANLPDDIALSIFGLQQLIDQAFQLVQGPLTVSRSPRRWPPGSSRAGCTTRPSSPARRASEAPRRTRSRPTATAVAAASTSRPAVRSARSRRTAGTTRSGGASRRPA